MEGFIQFVKMLFLGKALLLTPTPIDLNEYWTEIPLEKPLSAITAGAAVEVRFGKDHHYFKGSKDIMTASKIADDLLPTGTFEAEMIDRQGNILIADKRNILLVNEHAKYGITCNGSDLI